MLDFKGFFFVPSIDMLAFSTSWSRFFSDPSKFLAVFSRRRLFLLASAFCDSSRSTNFYSSSAAGRAVEGEARAWAGKHQQHFLNVWFSCYDSAQAIHFSRDWQCPD
jgi:hypothetical protein